MKSLAHLSDTQLSRIKVVLTDIDDTLTTEGQLTHQAYQALAALRDAGISIIPVTGRCAGWCDHIARMWPVTAIVGENGAFYFRYDHRENVMIQRFVEDAETREQHQTALNKLSADVAAAFPGIKTASDQAYRLTDLAIDIAEDVPRFPISDVKKIVQIAESRQATARISSIHVNCWMGEYSKLSTSLLALEEVLGIKNEEAQACAIFTGDSPNDETMFEHFALSVGVANIRSSIDLLKHPPSYVTEKTSGAGFVELAERLLSIVKPSTK